jgi:protein-L-isoaspartate(D-aspartate) O-methyltransferase
MDIEAARQQMIDQQVRAWDVLDSRVLETLARVPRELFVPEAVRAAAFADAEIPLACGQSMQAAKFHGRILQAVAVEPGDTALDIGTGSGYLTACLAALGAQTTSLECHAELAAMARANLRTAGFTGVSVLDADATTWEPTERYDVIVLGAALPAYDARYERWLKVGGRLFVVVGTAEPMTALLVTRTAEHDYTRTEQFETVIAPLANAVRPSRFVF